VAKTSRRCTISANIHKLEARLNSFDYRERISSLHELAYLVQREEVELTPQLGIVNMHCHTFFSYNAYGHSPASLAWLAKKSGFAAIGIVDFDVLDGVDEFLSAFLPLVGVIDRYFAKESGVMVMAEDLAVRENRLAQLQHIAALADGIVDLSRLEGF